MNDNLLSACREGDPSPRIQFELLTACVWLFEVFLLYTIASSRKSLHDFSSQYTIPVLHLIPWVIGLWQWKKAGRQTSIEEKSPKTAIQKAIVHILWGAYFALLNVEAVLLFHR